MYTFIITDENYNKQVIVVNEDTAKFIRWAIEEGIFNPDVEFEKAEVKTFA